MQPASVPPKGFAVRRLLVLVSVVVLLLSAAACSEVGGRHARDVYVLLDVSGSYNAKLDAANPAINYLLATLVSGDTLTVARINSGSFTEKDIIGKVTFDDRPSVANEQKRAFRQRLDQFLRDRHASGYTDISGAMLQAAEDLQASNAGRRYIVIFSDLAEDLPRGYVRKTRLPLAGVQVIALDVTKLPTDNVNPQQYVDRLAHWQKLVTRYGGIWQVLNDPANLSKVFND